MTRNKKQKEKYSPSKTQFRYCQKRKRCGRKRKFTEAESKKLVQHLFLDLQWSPERISNRLKMEKNKIQVSFSTIYRSIYFGDLETTKLSHVERGVAMRLRHRGKTRHKKGEEERRGKIRISHPIEERPKEALEPV